MTTYRDMLKAAVNELSDEELADFIYNNDFKNMAQFDNLLKGPTIKDKILELLRREVDKDYTEI